MKFSNFAPRFLRSILSLFGLAGISSCVMYGCPSADFAATGKVVDQKGNPLKDIVLAFDVYEHDGKVEYSPYDTLHTKADGSFSKKWGGVTNDQKLYLQDVDGLENGGEFEPRIYNLKDDLKQVKKGDRHWYIGSFEAKDLVIELEEKK